TAPADVRHVYSEAAPFSISNRRAKTRMESWAPSISHLPVPREQCCDPTRAALVVGELRPKTGIRVRSGLRNQSNAPNNGADIRKVELEPDDETGSRWPHGPDVDQVLAQGRRGGLHDRALGNVPHRDDESRRWSVGWVLVRRRRCHRNPPRARRFDFIRPFWSGLRKFRDARSRGLATDESALPSHRAG